MKLTDCSPFFKVWLCVLPAILLLSCRTQEAAKTEESHRKLPYAESELIRKFKFLSPPSRYKGTGSDMHWWTWGADSAVYVADDDGENFGGPSNYAHLLRITGVPPNHHVETVTDFLDVPFRKLLPEGKLLRRYINGIIAVDSALYLSVYDYDWNLKRNRPYSDSLRVRLELYHSWNDISDSTLLHNMMFTDNLSLNYGVAGIIKSADGGKTWTNIPDKDTPRFLGPSFAGLTFINFGPGYTNVPESLAPYVYAMSNDYSWESGDHLYMARVHKDSILYRDAWQFLSTLSTDYEPGWSSLESDSYPVFTDPGHVGHPTISYNAALKRYILGIYSDTIPHKENASVEEWRKWDKASELQLYESKNPWGPWKLIYNEMPFGGKDHSCYLPQIPNAWWSADGTEGVVMFAGDYTGRNFEYYGLMTWPFKMRLKEDK
jgi:hypothetical protein